MSARLWRFCRCFVRFLSDYIRRNSALFERLHSPKFCAVYGSLTIEVRLIALKRDTQVSCANLGHPVVG
jgi:hypothetical protein